MTTSCLILSLFIAAPPAAEEPVQTQLARQEIEFYFMEQQTRIDNWGFHFGGYKQIALVKVDASMPFRDAPARFVTSGYDPGIFRVRAQPRCQSDGTIKVWVHAQVEIDWLPGLRTPYQQHVTCTALVKANELTWMDGNPRDTLYSFAFKLSSR